MTTTKTCTECHVEKPFEDFYAHPAGKYGYAARCKVCVSEASKAKRRADPESYRSYNRFQRQHLTPEQRVKYRDTRRRYRAANKDSINAANRWLYRLHRAKVLADRKQRYQSHRIEILAKRKAARAVQSEPAKEVAR